MKRVDPGDDRVILCLNRGSSSVKLALFRLGKKETLLARGAAERIGHQNSRHWIDGPAGEKHVEQRGDFHDHRAALQAGLAAFGQLHLPKPEAVGHRVVHETTPGQARILSLVSWWAPSGCMKA